MFLKNLVLQKSHKKKWEWKTMAKSSDEQIEQDERKVLEALEQNANESIDTIAKKCGFSRQKVWRIIKNLENDKVIWGYTAITDENKFNFHHYILLLKRSNMPLDESLKKEVVFEKIDEYLPGKVKIDDIYYTNGRYDLVITFYAHDLVDAKRFYEAVLNRNPKMLQDHIMLDTIFPIRKKTFKNPKIKNFINYL